MYLLEKWSIQPEKIERMNEGNLVETTGYLSYYHCDRREIMLVRVPQMALEARTFPRL